MGIDLSEALAKAQQIADLEERAITANERNDTCELFPVILEIGELRSHLKLFLVDNCVVSLPKNVNTRASSVLVDLALHEGRPLDKLLQGTPLELFLHRGIEELGEPQQLAIDSFYTWTSGGDYVSILYEFPSLVLPESSIAHSIHQAVKEARVSYAFQNYLAVCSLSRTILEIVVKQICESERCALKTSLWETTAELCRMRRYAALKRPLDGIRRRANEIVHGERSIDHGEARELFRRTLCIVRNLCAQREKGRGIAVT